MHPLQLTLLLLQLSSLFGLFTLVSVISFFILPRGHKLIIVVGLLWLASLTATIFLVFAALTAAYQPMGLAHLLSALATRGTL